MIIETKDGRRIARPAGLKDTPKIIAASFAVNDRDKEVNLDKKTKGKTKTIILGNVKRDVLSTDLTEGMSIATYNHDVQVQESQQGYNR